MKVERRKWEKKRKKRKKSKRERERDKKGKEKKENRIEKQVSLSNHDDNCDCKMGTKI